MNRDEIGPYVSKNPELLSMLYDLDLLPEQSLKGTQEERKMLLIVEHFYAFEERMHSRYSQLPFRKRMTPEQRKKLVEIVRGVHQP